MASRLDAICSSSIVSNINSSSKYQLVIFLCSLHERQIKWLLFNLLTTIYPEMSMITTKFNNLSQMELIHFCNYMTSSFNHNTKNNQKSIESENIKYLLFDRLPSEIGAYIMSYSNMKDRLKYELISKDFYRFCQIPMAKYHLIIDHKFVKAIYQNSMDYKKYFHAQYLEIQYVFINSNISLSKYGDFGDKYDAILSSIVLKSPLLHTINYNLEYRRFCSNLESVELNVYNSYCGHLLQWIEYIRDNMYSPNNVFHSIKKIIWTPTQPIYESNVESQFKNKYELFIQYLPNLQSITIPTMKSFWNHTVVSWWTDIEDDELFIFKGSYYYNTLKHINIDMMSNREYITRNNIGRYKNVNIDNHPLSNFYQFKYLKSIKLILPIFNQCHIYYQQLWTDLKTQKYINFKCKELENISLEFKTSNITAFKGRVANNTQNCFGYIINKICKYIFNFCPNLLHYTLIINGIKHKLTNFDHFIGYFDRLESLYIDCPSMLPENARLSGLQRLSIQLQHDEDIKTKLIKLDQFPNLQSFQCIYVNKSDEKYLNLNSNIIAFMNHILDQKCNANKLKYIGLSHKSLQKPAKRRRKNARKIEGFNMKYGTKNQSLKICKLIISLTTNSCIKTVELNPVSLTQKELNYLSFWFNGEFGGMETKQHRSVKKGFILTDLYCAQSIDT